MAGLSGVRRDRRHRARLGLHRSGLHADEVVSRSARNGHRNGHHGLRRRRAHRCTSGCHLDVVLQDGHRPGCRFHVLHYGRTLRGMDAFWSLARSSSLGRLETRGLATRRHRIQSGTRQGRLGGHGLENAPVLAAVDCPVHERQRGYRHLRPSLTDVSGLVRRQRRGGRRVRRFAVDLQHGRPLLVVLRLRPHRPTHCVRDLLSTRRAAVFARSVDSEDRKSIPLRGSHSSYHLHVRRRLCHHSGLSPRPLRYLSSRSHPWPPDHGLVIRRHRRPPTHQLHLHREEEGRSARG